MIRISRASPYKPNYLLPLFPAENIFGPVVQNRAGPWCFILDLIEHLLQLGVVFIFQTGLLPIAFFCLFLGLLRNSIRR